MPGSLTPATTQSQPNPPNHRRTEHILMLPSADVSNKMPGGHRSLGQGHRRSDADCLDFNLRGQVGWPRKSWASQDENFVPTASARSAPSQEVVYNLVPDLLQSLAASA